MTPRRLLCMGAILALALGGCGGDDAPDGVLAADDVPNVQTVYSNSGTVNGVAGCGAIGDAEFSLTIGSNPPSAGAGFRLEGAASSGDYVSSQALGVAPRYSGPDEAMAVVQDAIDECANDSSGETFTPMTDLPPGVIGYRAVTETSNGARIGERVFAIQGDRIIAVGVQHDGPGEPTVDVTELLPVALERAKEAPDAP